MKIADIGLGVGTGSVRCHLKAREEGESITILISCFCSEGRISDSVASFYSLFQDSRLLSAVFLSHFFYSRSHIFSVIIIPNHISPSEEALGTIQILLLFWAGLSSLNCL